MEMLVPSVKSVTNLKIEGLTLLFHLPTNTKTAHHRRSHSAELILVYGDLGLESRGYYARI